MGTDEGVVDESIGAAEVGEDEEGVGKGGEGEERDEFGEEEALPVEAGDKELGLDLEGLADGGA